jgi:hypothetical protein
VFAPHAIDGRGGCVSSSYSSSPGRHLVELRVKTFNGGVFGCRAPPWRRWLGGFLLDMCFSR